MRASYSSSAYLAICTVCSNYIVKNDLSPRISRNFKPNEEIEVVCRKKLDPQKSIVFFDEIQANPVALQALRYFYEKHPDIAIISAGSLLELVLNKEAITMPVGRIEFFFLGPMTFTEFLKARGEDSLIEIIVQGSPYKLAFADHQLKNLLNEYFIVGGMPEAVSTYLSKDPQAFAVKCDLDERSQDHWMHPCAF